MKVPTPAAAIAASGPPAPAPNPGTPTAVAPLSTQSIAASLAAAFNAAPPAAPAETPKPETPAAPLPAEPSALETAPTTEDAPDAAPTDEPAPQWPQSAIDTVTGLRAERRELRADLDAERVRTKQIEERLNALEGKGPEAPGAAPEANEPAQAVQLRQAENTQRNLRNWARQTQRLAARDLQAATEELARQQINLPDPSLEGIRDWLDTVAESAGDKMADLAGQRRALVTEHTRASQTQSQQASALALHLIPELAKPETPRGKLYAEAMKNHPEMARHPNGPMIAASIVLGWEQLDKQIKALNGAPAAVPQSGTAPTNTPARTPSVRLPGAAPALPSAPAPETNTDRAAFAKFAKSGSARDKESWIKAALLAPA